jgi:hypothetical protein
MPGNLVAEATRLLGADLVMRMPLHPYRGHLLNARICPNSGRLPMHIVMRSFACSLRTRDRLEVKSIGRLGILTLLSRAYNADYLQDQMVSNWTPMLRG